MRGRKPKPTKLKELAGNPGRRPLNADEPQPTVGVPDCPDHLDDAARAEWDRIAGELIACGILTLVDRAALAAYCVCYSRWADAESRVKQSGVILKEPDTKDKRGNVVKGKLFKNPYLAIANEAMASMHSYLSDFGMSPSSRCRVKVEKAAAADPFEAFLKGTRAMPSAN